MNSINNDAVLWGVLISVALSFLVPVWLVYKAIRNAKQAEAEKAQK
jgi:hydrogenase-4 membrane subunit HyfE